jgi:hypothetical protein
LLYSRDFYALARQRLAAGGILQQWLYDGDDADHAAVTRALLAVFPYVRVYRSMWGGHSYHFLASMSPIDERNAQQLLAPMPATAIADMMEWGPAKTPEEQFDLLLSREVTPQSLIAPAPGTPELQDDRPINEYNRLRTIFPGKGLGAAPAL